MSVADILKGEIDRARAFRRPTKELFAALNAVEDQADMARRLAHAIHEEIQEPGDCWHCDALNIANALAPPEDDERDGVPATASEVDRTQAVPNGAGAETPPASHS